MVRKFSYLLLGAAFVLVPSVVFAQNTITVIQEDGTKVTVDLDEVDPLLPGKPEEPPPPPAPKAPIETPAPKPLQEMAPKPYVDKIIAPEPKAAAPVEEKPVAPIAEKPVKETPKKETKKSKSKKGKKSAEVKPAAKSEGHYEYVLPPGAVVTESLAASIALDSAPASSGYTVQRQNYKGTDVFVVTFKTEEGPYDVLVDAQTGKIVVSAYVETPEPGPTAPGHLPQNWEPFKPIPVGRPAKQ